MPYVPDGSPINDEVMEFIEKKANIKLIHLRLVDPDDTRKVKAGCNNHLFAWWSGDIKQVNCPECLELIHA